MNTINENEIYFEGMDDMGSYSTPYEVSETRGRLPIETIEIDGPGVIESNPYGTMGTVFGILQWLSYATVFITFIIGIIFLVKSIKNMNKVKTEDFEKAIKSTKTISIVLLVYNLLLLCSNFIMAILSIISLVFATKAVKNLESDVELSKQKSLKANTINVISSCIMIASPIINMVIFSIIKVLLMPII